VRRTSGQSYAKYIARSSLDKFKADLTVLLNCMCTVGAATLRVYRHAIFLHFSMSIFCFINQPYSILACTEFIHLPTITLSRRFIGTKQSTSQLAPVHSEVLWTPLKMQAIGIEGEGEGGRREGGGGRGARRMWN
jgi:hypothetical protein